MRCPVDNETLVMADRNGVEIDYCPKCRGVWLDRGELDKVIERAGAAPAAAQPMAVPVPPQSIPHPDPQAAHPQAQRPEPRYRDDDDDDDRRRKPYRKRESFLTELFDF